MEQLRVRNLRSIVDSTTIAIKPITLLVGGNSSGKSSFLRIFPLLKQSHEIRTLGGLVLNEGDVNFGFFDETLNKDADPAELKLEFGFTLQHGLYQGAQWNHFLLDAVEANCELTYVRRAKDARYPRLSQIRLSLTDGSIADVLRMEINEDGKLSAFFMNDLEGTADAARYRIRIGRGLIPRLSLELSKEDVSEQSFDTTSPFDLALLAATDSIFHGKMSRENRLAMFRSTKIGSPEKMLSYMRENGGAGWRDRTKYWTKDTLTFQKIRNLVFARHINDLLDSVDVYLTQLAKSVYYFQPVRANVQRDYLSRDVSVISVDPSGLNVAMVLASMPVPTQIRFREWMRKNFGFEVYPRSVGDGARIALRMKEVESGSDFNLADTGFGFSQMLPFLVQIWSLVDSNRVVANRGFRPFRANATSFLIAVEQPELHLHPALQARLADMIVMMTKLSQEQNLPLRFVLETHSPTIIERIGQSVEEKLTNRDDVQVVLFELERGISSASNRTKVCVTGFDEAGVLQSWPFGFLAAPLTPVVI